MRLKKTESLSIEDFIINDVKGKSNLVICVSKGPAVGQKRQQKPQRCNVRSMTSVVNNAGFSNDQIKSLIISLIKLTEGCSVVYLLFSFQ